MAAVLSILSPAHRRRRGPHLSLYIPDVVPPPSYRNAVSTATLPTTSSACESTVRIPHRPRNRLRKRQPGPRKSTFDREREARGQHHGFSESDFQIQSASPCLPRGTLGGFRGLDELDVPGAKSKNGGTVIPTEHEGSVSDEATQPEGVGNRNVGLGLRLRRGRAPGRRQDSGESSDSWYLSLPLAEIPYSIIIDKEDEAQAFQNNNSDIHPAYRNSGPITIPKANPMANPDPVVEPNLYSSPDSDSASDAGSGLELSRLKSNERRTSTSSSLYSTYSFTSPATTISDHHSPGSVEAENESADVSALVLSAERLAAEYRALLLSRTGTPLPARSARATPDPFLRRSIEREGRILRKVKGIRSLRKLVRGAHREIVRERKRESMDSAICMTRGIDEERFSFSEGDDADEMRTSHLFSDAETLVSVMDGEFGVGKKLEEEEQWEDRKEEHHFDDVRSDDETGENLVIPPRHPGRISRAWMAATPTTPTTTAPNTKQDATGCCRRRREKKDSSQDDLRSPVILRVEEICFRSFCDGCGKKVVWMADAAEVRMLRSKDIKNDYGYGDGYDDHKGYSGEIGNNDNAARYP